MRKHADHPLPVAVAKEHILAVLVFCKHLCRQQIEPAFCGIRYFDLELPKVANVHTTYFLPDAGVSSYKCDTGDDPNNAASLASGQVTTKNPTLEWSKSICIAAHGGTSDPILSGANSAATPVQLIRNSNIYSNRYDYACSNFPKSVRIWIMR